MITPWWTESDICSRFQHISVQCILPQEAHFLPLTPLTPCLKRTLLELLWWRILQRLCHSQEGPWIRRIYLDGAILSSGTRRGRKKHPLCLRLPLPTQLSFLGVNEWGWLVYFSSLMPRASRPRTWDKSSSCIFDLARQVKKQMDICESHLFWPLIFLFKYIAGNVIGPVCRGKVLNKRINFPLK